MNFNTSWTPLDTFVAIPNDNVYAILTSIFRAGLNPTLALGSIVANVFNVLVFWRMGLRDGVNATFFLLSIADGAGSLLAVSGLTCALFLIYGPLSLKPTAESLVTLILVFNNIPLYTSMFATLVISVVRCCSVAMPLKVKAILTTRRQLAAIFVLSTTAVVALSLGWTAYALSIQFDPRTNTSHLWVSLTSKYVHGIGILDHYRNAVFFTCMTTVTICFFVLIHAMRKSTKFRSTTGGAAAAKHTGESESAPGNAGSQANKSAESKSAQREKQVIKTVALVSAVFILCTVPYMLMSVIRICVPEFRSMGAYSRLWDVNMMMIECCSQINAFFNIFIFLSTNYRYQKTFWAMFHSKKT